MEADKKARLATELSDQELGQTAGGMVVQHNVKEIHMYNKLNSGHILYFCSNCGWEKDFDLDALEDIPSHCPQCGGALSCPMPI